MGGAGAVSVDDGRQPLDVGAEHLGHGLLLGFAQFGEFLGDMGYRAMVLADLHTVNRPAHPRGGGDVAGFAERRCDPLGGRLERGVVGTVGRRDVGQDASIRRRANVRTASSPPISRSCRMAADARSS